jgi:UDP-glucose 4-epimerase
VNILITGGAGFIGSHVAERMLARGAHVVVIDNFSTGRRDNLRPHSDVVLREGSIADAGLVDRVFTEYRPDVVLHAAASYKDPHDWAEDVRTNTLGTAHVVRAAERAKVSRLIFLQTALCYGLHPLEQPITLNHPLRPEGSSYALSKTAGEQYIALSQLDFISFRLANAYGPRNLSGPLPTFYQRLTAGKRCFVMDTRRDFIYVDDLVAVVVQALEGAGRRGYYHVSSGSDYAIKELYDCTVSALGLRPSEEVEVRRPGPDDVASILLDPSRTNEDFGWRATTPLAEGVGRAISYYRQHDISQTFTHLKLPTE